MNKPEFENIDQGVVKTNRTGEHLIIAAPSNEPSGYKSGIDAGQHFNVQRQAVGGGGKSRAPTLVSGAFNHVPQQYVLEDSTGAHWVAGYKQKIAVTRRKPKAVSKNTLNLINRVINVGTTP